MKVTLKLESDDLEKAISLYLENIGLKGWKCSDVLLADETEDHWLEAEIEKEEGH